MSKLVVFRLTGSDTLTIVDVDAQTVETVSAASAGQIGSGVVVGIDSIVALDNLNELASFRTNQAQHAA